MEKAKALNWFFSFNLNNEQQAVFSGTRPTTHNQASSLQGLSFLRRKGIKVANDPVMLTGYKPLA